MLVHIVVHDDKGIDRMYAKKKSAKQRARRLNYEWIFVVRKAFKVISMELTGRN